MLSFITGRFNNRQTASLLAGLAICFTLGLAVGAGETSAANVPLWFESGHLKPEAWQAVDILANASAEGLEPQDYAASNLLKAITQAAEEPELPDEVIAQLDAALTKTMQHYL